LESILQVCRRSRHLFDFSRTFPYTRDFWWKWTKKVFKQVCYWTLIGCFHYVKNPNHFY
jgi:hypothetical protein